MPPEPRSRESVQFNGIGQVLLTAQNVTNLLSGGRKKHCFACWCGTPAESNTAARGAQAQGAGGGRAIGGLKPEVKVGGDRPPRLGGDVVTFENIREFLVAYSDYEQQMHTTNQDGGDRVLASSRELVDSATQMMVADEFYDGKPLVDLFEEELTQGCKRFAGVDIHQTNDQDFCRQIFYVLKMDASVPVDSRVFMHKRALRKYLADSRLTGW